MKSSRLGRLLVEKSLEITFLRNSEKVKRKIIAVAPVIRETNF